LATSCCGVPPSRCAGCCGSCWNADRVPWVRLWCLAKVSC
jgi:hypothetical protein